MIITLIRRDHEYVYSRANFFSLLRQNSLGTLSDAHELEGFHSGWQKLELLALCQIQRSSPAILSHSSLPDWIISSHACTDQYLAGILRYLYVSLFSLLQSSDLNEYSGCLKLPRFPTLPPQVRMPTGIHSSPFFLGHRLKHSPGGKQRKLKELFHLFPISQEPLLFIALCLVPKKSIFLTYFLLKKKRRFQVGR